jgi:phosphocarrier protein
MSAKESPQTDGALTKVLTVINRPGMHARPAANLARTATKFKCDIMIEKDGETVNAKSIMGLMMLAAGPGTKLTVHATGADASAALGELDALAKRKFDVPED